MTQDMTAARAEAALERFLSQLGAPDLVRLQLTQPASDATDGAKPLAGAAGPERCLIRPVQLRGESHWQAVWRHATKDITENWPLAQGQRLVAGLLREGAWRSAMLWTRTAQWQLDTDRKGRPRLTRHRVADTPAATSTAHDRSKSRPLDLAHPAWVGLGLAQLKAGGTTELVPAMARKWKQINHFVSIFEGALKASGWAADRPLRVADFGCGRGYLTFAVALHLAGRGAGSSVLGVELREELVRQAETLARQHGVEGLHFASGDIREHPLQALDVMIALHACDTATDLAIFHGLQAGAGVILCAPCCHKELRPQMQVPGGLAGVFRHGIHLGQEAEMLTDAVRALLLESQGYDTQVFEFTSLEHTAKNKMILAVRRPQPDARRQAEALAQMGSLKAFWSLKAQCLEQLVLRR